MRRRPRSLAGVLLVVALLAVLTVQPARAQTPNGLQLFTEVYRLVTQEALAPPAPIVLLRAAADGMQRALRSQGVDLRTVELSGVEAQDLQTMQGLLRQAMALAPRGFPPMEVAYAAIKAMVEAVGDRNTVFLTPFEQARFNEQQQEPPPIVGIGVTLSEQGGRVVITSVVEDSPAARGGVLPQDLIMSVNGQPAEGRNLSDVRQMIAGEEGGEVVLVLFRPSTGETLTVPLFRARIVQPTASARMIGPEIGYLRLTQFREGSAVQLASLLRQLQSEGARGLILDLRNNPGGFLIESVDIASHFLRGGVVTTVRGTRDRTTTYLVRPREPKFLADVVVLVNRRSASASEVVAGALQDAGVQLIGERTFGKGTVQLVYEFDDGSGLRLTVARYLTRNGREVEGVGLVPDVAVPFGLAVVGTPSDPQLQRAMNVVAEMLRRAALAATR
ncbi:MAG: carboxy-terminal processing protease, carboxyl-terminal processing protease [Armatimonadetes bacterium CSP1-3]|nr:MAG: carboxy-terminal processing protease, carboxyl-terminal processing protease [Armatimonadetes bacterium CSP1-3]